MVILALIDAHVPPYDMSIVQGVRFILSKQREDGFLQWSGPGPGSYYGTARALLGVLVGTLKEDYDRIRINVEKAIRALADGELPCGGWEANPGGGLSHWGSAEVLFAVWYAGKMYMEEIWRSPMNYYSKFKRWFMKTQSALGSWDGNCLDCTARVATFLSFYGYRGPEVKMALQFILNHQGGDGRIGDSPWATAWSLLAMVASKSTDGAIQESARAAVSALIDSQLDDGGWPIFYDSDTSFESVTAASVWALATYKNSLSGVVSVLGV
ncbi:hypothetical protein IPA_00055 [Ignicoccus pacificus DSM 13166]|uniref:Squalene cyclase C-terminal domain-containing protein n=1 Tax=Ignicoccus pacificus DSM 13166 TaxID=940294 RepID=A0A977PJP7_9CREN|nr:hypothetical protein IPA_00055 [Ignicoccus pacificus DSM 13166]